MLAVVAAIASIVSAFNDGNSIVRQIKDKRKARKALPPTKYLEESLTSGPPAIEAEKDNGLREFGLLFGNGDRTSRMPSTFLGSADNSSRDSYR